MEASRPTRARPRSTRPRAGGRVAPPRFGRGGAFPGPVPFISLTGRGGALDHGRWARGFDARRLHMAHTHGARLYHYGESPDGAPSRVFAECLMCLDDDPDREVGEVFGCPTVSAVLRVLRNHQAQRHDHLPSRLTDFPRRP